MKQKNGISKRDLLQDVGAAVALSALVGSDGESAAAARDPQMENSHERPRVFALIGDRYHNSDYIRVSLGRFFAELNLPVDYSTNYDHVSRNVLRNNQLFVCFRDGMIWPGGYLGPDAYRDYAQDLENRSDFPKATPETWITDEQGEAVKEFGSVRKWFLRAP
jgi:hypothetical protein